MSWQRPKTVKLYLHAPEAERLVTIWPDMKIVNTEVDRIDRGFGIRLLHGGEAQEFDWTRTRWQVRPDGVPIPIAGADADGLVTAVEAFCTWDARPVTHLRITLTNPSAAGLVAVLGLMPRTGLDSLLHGIAPDFYASYRPTIAHWDMVPCGWKWEEPALTDGAHMVRLSLPDGVAAQWVERNPHNQFANGYLELRAKLAGGAAITVDCVLADADAKGIDAAYEPARDAAVERWQRTLAGIKVRPTGNAAMQSMVSSLVAQCLQMFAAGADGVVRPRQGGRNGGVWPTEAIEFLRALDRMGLSEWSEKGYRFLARSQVIEGPDKGRILSVGSPSWMNPTGATLYGLAYHLARANDPAKLAEWRETMRLGLAWIAAQRDKTRSDPDALGYGLMPPGKAHDWGIDGQTWCFTDGFTYLGVREAAQVLAQYKDPLAGEVKAAADEYEKCLKTTLARIVKAAGDRDELFVPNLLGVPESYPPVGPYFADGPAMLIRAGIVDPKSEVFDKIERYFVRRGWMRNGLTGLMTDCLLTQGFLADQWAGHTWYTSYPDMAWFTGWLARGDRAKARKTLDAQVRYGMTAEWTMQERYADNDASFCPWQPNASANGRLLMMLMDFHGVGR